MMDEFQLNEKLSLLDELQSSCTHCGLCNEGCATFQATGWEHESPRGRLQLSSRFLHGQIQQHSDALSTFDRCLGCRACETLCPHHVQYHQVRGLVQEIRRDLELKSSSLMSLGNYQQWIKFASRIGSALWRYYGSRWLKIPKTHLRASKSFSGKCKKIKSGVSTLAICCVQDVFQQEAIEQAVSFIKGLGEEIQVDCNQPCCGALFERLCQGGGESISYPKQQKIALDLQTKTRETFIKWMKPSTYFLSRCCESFISKDSNVPCGFFEWIENLLQDKGMSLQFPEPRSIYYQPYCRSKKGNEDPILRILKKIKGLTVYEIANPKACCGGYCGETLLHEENAKRLAKEKLFHLPNGATLVVTSPDCWGLFKQFSSGLDLTICYPIEILTQGQLIHSEQPY